MVDVLRHLLNEWREKNLLASTGIRTRDLWVTGPTLYRLSYRGSRQSESRILTQWRRRFSLFIKHGHRDAKLASFWSRYYSQLVFAWVNPKAWFWHIYILNKWREKNLLASTGIRTRDLWVTGPTLYRLSYRGSRQSVSLSPIAVHRLHVCVLLSIK